MKKAFKTGIAGALAGMVSGLFSAGGGMILVPLLNNTGELNESEIFPASVSIILPICIVCLCIRANNSPLQFQEALPYLLGSLGGGLLAALTGHKIPTKWLHRTLGLLIIWGGIRYLC